VSFLIFFAGNGLIVQKNKLLLIFDKRDALLQKNRLRAPRKKQCKKKI